MRTRITLRTIVEHIQGVKNDLQQQIVEVERRMGGRMDRLEKKMTNLEEKVDRGFEEARNHRQALQEDLEATILMVGKHDAKLKRLQRI